MDKRTNKRMKQMAAAMMAGMLAMCTEPESQAEEGEGWAVEGSCSACIPLRSMQETWVCSGDRICH